MTTTSLKAGLIGCGDYLRWETEPLQKSKNLRVKYTFDLDAEKSKTIGEKLGATPVKNVDTIFSDPEIRIVLIFTPPWAREKLFGQAADNGKHIITTKPLAPSLEEAKKLYEIVHGKVSCNVFYGRVGDPAVETLKKVLESGEIGTLALYKEDWLHHYPQWNDWATDPEKNGGPFMDAMIHNLNKARYLVNSNVKSVNYFSDNYAQSLKCNDTESMKLNFENGSSAYLFITWAADLEVYSKDGNDREHFGILHMITDRGWYITEEEEKGRVVIRAKKEDKIKEWPVEDLPLTAYDEVSKCIQEGKDQKYDIVTALEDIEIMERARNNISRPVML